MYFFITPPPQGLQCINPIPIEATGITKSYSFCALGNECGAIKKDSERVFLHISEIRHLHHINFLEHNTPNAYKPFSLCIATQRRAGLGMPCLGETRGGQVFTAQDFATKNGRKQKATKPPHILNCDIIYWTNTHGMTVWDRFCMSRGVGFVSAIP